MSSGSDINFSGLWKFKITFDLKSRGRDQVLHNLHCNGKEGWSRATLWTHLPSEYGDNSGGAANEGSRKKWLDLNNSNFPEGGQH